VFYELTIIPKYFLIARWGSTRKEYGAMKLALYSFVGSHLVLIGLIAAWVVARAQTGHATLQFDGIVTGAIPAWFPALGFSAGVRRVRDPGGFCGRSTPGRRPVTSLRRLPARCCLPAW